MLYKILNLKFHILLCCILAHFSMAFNCLAAENQKFPEAQAFIQTIVSEHPEIVRLTIHAIPTGQESSRIIACNLTNKIGKPSDPEDLEEMKTKGRLKTV